MTRRLSVLLLALVALFALPAAARAELVSFNEPLQQRVSFSGYCGDATVQHVAPPTVPNLACPGSRQYSSSTTGLLGARLGTHATGSITASAYVRTTGTRTATVRLMSVDSAGVYTQLASVPVPANDTGEWFTTSPLHVAASDTLEVQVRNSASSTATGQVHVYAFSANSNADPVLPVGLGQPGNWAWTPIPSNVAAMDPSVLSPTGKSIATEAVRELAGQAASTFMNTASFTPKFNRFPAGTPFHPVRMCRSTTSGTCVPSYMTGLARAALGVSNTTTIDPVTGKPTGTITDLGGGVPFESSLAGAPGSDQEVVVRIDDFVARNADGSVFLRPDGQKVQGLDWELWHFREDPTFDSTQPESPTNTKYMAAYGTRRTGYIVDKTKPVDSQFRLDTLSGAYVRGTNVTSDSGTLKRWYGPNVLDPGSPNSTNFSNGWSVTAAKLPMGLANVISGEDCQRVLSGASQSFDHAVGLQTQYSRFPGGSGSDWWYPANGSDGQPVASTLALVQGMRFRLEPNTPIPAGLNGGGLALFLTIRDHGFAVDDTTGGSPGLVKNADGSYASGGGVRIRSELNSSECATLGVTSSQLRLVTALFAQHLVMLPEGSDGNPFPTTP